jgi:hypothetical protein
MSDVAAGDRLDPEEPWEAEIGALLAGMPAVEPPDGFIAAAVDHRPLHARRTLLSLVLATAVVILASELAGLVDGQASIPEIGLLTSRHSSAQANLLSSEAEDGPAGEGAAGQGAAGVDGTEASSPISLPAAYRREAMIEVDDLRQAVYSRGGETVSVFVQAGRVDWEALPASGRVSIADQPAWVDESLQVTVLEAGDQTVTIVGLPPGEVAEMIEALPPERLPLSEWGLELAGELAEQLGFPGSG